MTAASDRAWMEMAYGLAEKARGRTSPNPMVGAVVVKDGAVAGWGWHEGPGRPHAEIVALGRAGARARGATLYLTLEPCVHWGRTPPCVDAVLAAGLARVVVSAADANPLVDGRGLRRLERAGTRVTAGLLADRNAALNEAHVKFITRKVPFVTLKAALTADGKIACRTGDSRWISSAATRDYVHLLRGEQDAVLIGAGTLLADDPRLTVRHAQWAGKQVLRAVLDRRLRFPPAARMLAARGGGPVLVFAGREASIEKARALERRGAEIALPPGGAKAWTLDLVLAELGRRSIAALLVEGGSRVFTAFIEGRLADKAVVTVSPRLAGGAEAPGLFGGRGAAKMTEALALRRARSFAVGEDIVLEGYF